MPSEPDDVSRSAMVPDAPVRTDAHNLEVDEAAATNHLCGMRHLATGHECRLPERHRGGCDFSLAGGGPAQGHDEAAGALPKEQL
jgi:hypothetical protein